MLILRKLTKNPLIAAPIYNASARHFTTPNPNPNSTPIPSSAQYDDLINAAGRRRDFSAVRSLLADRLRNGCLNTNNTFNFIAVDVSVLDDLLHSLADLDDWFTRKHAHDALVAQLAKLHRAAAALRVAEAMVRKSYGATAATFLPILNALAKRKEMSAAWRVVEVMRESKIQPVLTAFNYILTAYCYVGDVAEAVDAVVRMEAEGLRADARTYDALVLGACRAGKVEAAVAVMRRMEEDGVTALFSTHAHVIKEMVSCGYYAQAVEFVRIFAGRDEKLDSENFGFLANRLKNVKRITEAELVVEEMVKRGLSIGDGLKNLSSNLHVK
ncbi:hypothetical protein BUALT_Bualt01G0051000 [Buddleja alternifolia]|uniref:PROP1-like PPR domain-containing protein n=1 Tax=Buddleja alternifolia TaxID=168488 RepID=A0AAV6Y8P8_9LAMI|nr:hypothetical protein BUALT_Bualt01G0051000 [Buddleja alternifolia]